MSRVPEFVRCGTCGEIKPEKARWLCLIPMVGTHHEEYCSWRCLVVRYEQQLVPGKNRPTGVG